VANKSICPQITFLAKTGGELNTAFHTFIRWRLYTVAQIAGNGLYYRRITLFAREMASAARVDQVIAATE
jgi:hypothetical protein